MAAYYNEIDPVAAEWLRNLIKAGHIAPGEVDTRSIVDVRPDDLRGFTQCHFFAGIGGWSLALRLAGWGDDRPVWTGSCPCQPFSSAGKQSGSEDERHLWPAFFGLIRECRPRSVFGEQVASSLGRAWLDHVLADLESAGYAAAAANLPACSVGAPHIRQRLWFVADASGAGTWRDTGAAFVAKASGGGERDSDGVERGDAPVVNGAVRLVADSDRRRLGECGKRDSQAERSQQPAPRRHDADGCGSVRILGDAKHPGLEGFAGDVGNRNEPGRIGADAAGSVATAGASDPWRNLEWLACRDGKARPTQPGLFPLAHGVSGRVGRLRAYGNAIVPQVAAEVIGAFMEIHHG